MSRSTHVRRFMIQEIVGHVREPEAFREWYRILAGRKEAAVHEAPYVRTAWGEAWDLRLTL